MDNVLEILRPQEATLKIWGEEYKLRRLRYPCVLKTLGGLAKIILQANGGSDLSDIRDKADVAALLRVVASTSEEAAPLLDGILAEALPDFKHRQELPLEDVLEILAVIWEHNRLGDAVKNFFGKMNKAVPGTA